MTHVEFNFHQARVVNDVEHRNRFAVRVKDTKERGAMRVAAAPSM